MKNEATFRFGLNIKRLDGQTWEKALKADQKFWRLRKNQRTELISGAKKRDRQESRSIPISKPLPTPSETEFTIPEGMTPEEATREKIKRDAERYPTTMPVNPPQTQARSVDAELRILLDNVREADSGNQKKINKLNVQQLQHILLSDEFCGMPEGIKKIITDRFLALETISNESFWQDF